MKREIVRCLRSFFSLSMIVVLGLVLLFPTLLISQDTSTSTSGMLTNGIGSVIILIAELVFCRSLFKGSNTANPFVFLAKLLVVALLAAGTATFYQHHSSFEGTVFFEGGGEIHVHTSRGDMVVMNVPPSERPTNKVKIQTRWPVFIWTDETALRPASVTYVK